MAGFLRPAVALGLLVAAQLVTGCTCSRSRASHGDASAAPATSPSVSLPIGLLLLREEVFEHVAWTSDGAVAALSDRRFWWFRPEGSPVARTTAIPDRGHGTLAVAAKADVAVVTRRGQAHVFHGAVKASSFTTREDESATALSDDGEVLATESLRDGRYRVGHTYETTTGKRLADLSSPAILSPGRGEWTLGADGVRSTRDGAVVAAFEGRGGDGGAWVDGRAALWAEEGLVVFDPIRRTTQRIAARCRDREIDEAIELIDPVGKQAVRYCGRRLLVVRLADLTMRDIPVPATRARHGEKASVRFRDRSDAILLDWGGGSGAAEVDEVDLPLRTMHSLAVLPPLRKPDGTPPHGEPVPSPDGRFLLATGRGSKDGIPLVVTERESKREIVRWGLPDTPQGSQLAAFLHEGGLDIVSDVEGRRERVRLGPSAAPFANVPLLEPREPCPVDPGSPPRRILSGQEAIYQGAAGSCVCVASGCVSPNLPEGVEARLDNRLIVSTPAMRRVTYLEDRLERGRLDVKGEIWGSAFLDGGKGVALLVVEEPLSDVFELREATLPGFEERRRWRLPRHSMGGHLPTVMATARSIAVARSYLGELRASVVVRAGDAGTPTEIDAWIGGGVVSLPDGRFELFGPNSDGALVCLEEATGIVTPFAACRDRYE
ncbi:MAG TPA: hypothetical protein VLT33_41905, partial [Labilithrix sp.]|nr:hypothetical protein [Labilithrix sp.]